MMTNDVLAASIQPVLALRGRGIAFLIKGLMEGDPLTVGVVVVLGLGIVGYLVYQKVSGSIDE